MALSKGVPSNEGATEGHPLKNVILALLVRLTWKYCRWTHTCCLS